MHSILHFRSFLLQCLVAMSWRVCVYDDENNNDFCSLSSASHALAQPSSVRYSVPNAALPQCHGPPCRFLVWRAQPTFTCFRLLQYCKSSFLYCTSVLYSTLAVLYAEATFPSLGGEGASC
jgi:hypothetical protein